MRFKVLFIQEGYAWNSEISFEIRVSPRIVYDEVHGMEIWKNSHYTVIGEKARKIWEYLKRYAVTKPVKVAEWHDQFTSTGEKLFMEIDADPMEIYWLFGAVDPWNLSHAHQFSLQHHDTIDREVVIRRLEDVRAKLNLD